jgi:hypothetical protein
MRFASALATLVAGCALALVVAYWGWQIFGPPPVRLVTPAPADPAATIVAADLFHGGAQATSAGGPAGAVLSGDARLIGIIAEPRQKGYALFLLPSGAKLVAQGDAITAGATLVSVQPDAITIRDGAGERRFVLRPAVTSAAQPASKTSASAGASVARANSATPPTCAPPAGFRGSVVRLNAELLGGLVGDAAPWRALVSSGPGGLVVRENGGFGALLGLRSGDRIAQANGIALTGPDDVVSAVIRPLIANQGVRLVGSRDGAKHELWLANVACAG